MKTRVSMIGKIAVTSLLALFYLFQSVAFAARHDGIYIIYDNSNCHVGGAGRRVAQR